MSESNALMIRPAERGVALGIVVWFIAGMALLVSGIMAEAKIDTRLAQLHYARAKATASGDGAIQLALAEQLARKQSGQKGGARSREFQIGGNNVAIRMIPGGLLVNISSEDIQGLTALFSVAASAARLSNQHATMSADQLARAVVAYRGGVQGRKSRDFHALEDLMRVPGVDRGVYDAVRDYIVTENLAGNISGQGQNMRSRLNRLTEAMAGNGAMLDGSVPTRADNLRVDAIVTIGDQQWLRRCWVSIGEPAASGLPWNIVRREAARPLTVGLSS